MILNNDKLNLLEWRLKAAKYRNISVYQLPERMALGRCLNFGISKAMYGYIAKFDHDDYYAPKYLADAMGNFYKGHKTSDHTVSDRSVGEDVKFLRDCRKKRFKIYSSGKLHFVYIRTATHGKHTTII